MYREMSPGVMLLKCWDSLLTKYLLPSVVLINPEGMIQLKGFSIGNYVITSDSDRRNSTVAKYVHPRCLVHTVTF